MKNRVLWSVVLMTLLAFLGFVLIGCQGGGEKEVRIAFLDCLSGSNADAGIQDLNAAQLAVDDINAAGGIKALGGAKVKLVVVDITSDPQNAASTAERVFSTEKVIAAKGSGISAMALPTLPIAEKARIPIVLNSINDQISGQGYKYTFQIAPHGSQFGATQVEFLKWLNQKYNLGLKDVAVVYENSGYGVSTAGGIKDIAAKAGLNLVLFEAYPHGFTDASSLVTKIKASKAQALFPVAYTTDAKLILNTMKQMNVAPVIIGGGAGFLWPAFFTELGSGVNGFVSVASWNWDSKNISSVPERAGVTERYEKKYNTYMTEHAGPSYVAVRMIAEAVEQAKSTDPEKLRAALASYDSNGPVGGLMQPGVTKINASGWNGTVHPIMIQWQDNKPRTIFPEADAVRAFKPAK
jgi:branched-chain amino acid transport system substrate-binding protein